MHARPSLSVDVGGVDAVGPVGRLVEQTVGRWSIDPDSLSAVTIVVEDDTGGRTGGRGAWNKVMRELLCSSMVVGCVWIKYLICFLVTSLGYIIV